MYIYIYMYIYIHCIYIYIYIYTSIASAKGTSSGISRYKSGSRAFTVPNLMYGPYLPFMTVIFLPSSSPISAIVWDAAGKYSQKSVLQSLYIHLYMHMCICVYVYMPIV